MTPALGVAVVLDSIRKSLASLAPATVPGVPPTPVPGVPTPAARPLVPTTPQVPKQQAQAQDPSRQVLLEMSRLLASINGPVSNPPPPTAPWNSNDSFAKFFNGTETPGRCVGGSTYINSFSGGINVTPTPSVVNTATPLVSKNWLFGFNVFMSVLLEKKPDLGISLIYYAKKILKAQHTYGGSACLEYDRDFRWAKVEDPSIGWDQTKVNFWLECVNNKVPGR
ncbi:hypothetical protein NDU88_003313 [Pleurodeles waltl]|uniref:Uncharacterized protein n=1 Tax=Pleurodeles waltl TaxID=8319 RepID=A0AAV7KW74_PLEWA|nr:hypothetical protein NDU88_003313 [Pleurodeles waltl]